MRSRRGANSDKEPALRGADEEPMMIRRYAYYKEVLVMRDEMKDVEGEKQTHRRGR